jgi:hypothetical protein
MYLCYVYHLLLLQVYLAFLKFFKLLVCIVFALIFVKYFIVIFILTILYVLIYVLLNFYLKKTKKDWKT